MLEVLECIHVLGIVLLFTEEVTTLNNIIIYWENMIKINAIIALLLSSTQDETKKSADTQNKGNTVEHLKSGQH